MFNEEEPSNIRQNFVLEDDEDANEHVATIGMIHDSHTAQVAVVDLVNGDDHQINHHEESVNQKQNVVIAEERISYEPQNVQMFSLHDDTMEEHAEDDIIVHDGKEKTQLDEMLEFEKTASEQGTTPSSTIEKIKKYFKDEFQFKSRKLNVFYTSHFLAAWGDRMWAFALPVIFGDMFPETLLPMALMGFIQKFIGIILGPHMGYLVDTMPRFRVMSIALIVQNVSVALTTLLIFLLGYFGWREKDSQPQTETDALFIWPFETVLSIVIFFLCALIGSLSDLSSMVTSVARTKDWCLVVARGEKLPLERINSMMRRLDMVSLIVSPVLFGLILTFAGYKVGAIVVCLWNVFSLVPEYICIHYVYKNTKELHVTKLEQELKIKEERDRELLEANEGMQQIDLEPTEETVNLKHQNVFKILFMGWKSYLTQKVFLSSLAFVFLFITVLTHSGLLLSYLKSHKIHSAVLGTFQALSAISGLLSTFIAPYLIMRINVFRGGLASIYFQFLSLVVGVLCFIVFNFWTEKFYFAVYFFLVGIIFSRLGLYAFDLAEIQIMQQLVDQKDSGIVNSTEGSLTKIADLVVFFSALFFSTPSRFIFLACGSLCCVGIAALLYTFWYLRNRKHMSQWLKEIEEEERKRSK